MTWNSVLLFHVQRLRVAWASDARCTCLTLDWRSVAQAEKKCSQDPPFWGNCSVVRPETQLGTVPGFTGNSREKWQLFWLSLPLKCVGCSIWYSFIILKCLLFLESRDRRVKPTGGTWTYYFLEGKGELKKKQTLEILLPRAALDTCLGLGLVPRQAPLSPAHTCKGQGALLSPGGARVSESRQGRVPSERAGWGCQSPVLLSPPTLRGARWVAFYCQDEEKVRGLAKKLLELQRRNRECLWETSCRPVETRPLSTPRG